MRNIDFAICRVEKVKEPSSLKAMAGHQMRSRFCPNADADRDNRLLLGTGDVVADVGRRISESGAKVRTNSVRAIEAVLSASPTFFRPDTPEAVGTWQPERLRVWAPAAVSWLQEYFGRQNVVSAVLHLDESTPHLHAVIVPVDNTPTQRGPSVRLNAARWLDGRARLAEMQDSYARAMAPLGLERGIKGRRIKHQKVAYLYGKLATDQRHAASERERASEIAAAIDGFADGRWTVEEQKRGVTIHWRTERDKHALQPTLERVWPQVGRWAVRASRGLRKRAAEVLGEAHDILSSALDLQSTRDEAARLTGRIRRLARGRN
mgnify:CR=1 FL=1